MLSVLVVLLRALLSSGRTEDAVPLLERALELSEDYDSEGFLPLLLAWRARLLVDAGDLEGARTLLGRIAQTPGRRWLSGGSSLSQPRARPSGRPSNLPRRRALRIADASGFRFYAMRARQILARVVEDESEAARHGRVGDALARSLAANLPREEGATFLEKQGVRPRGRVPR